MEIEQPVYPQEKPLMHGFWTRFRVRIYLFTVIVELLLAFGIFSSLKLLDITDFGWVTTLAIAAGAGAVMSIVTAGVVYIITKPFGVLIQTVIFADEDPLAPQRPNPNKRSYETSGFRDVMQTVYDLASQTSLSTHDSASIQASGLLATGLENSGSGVVIMDSKQQILYSNHAAPVSVDINGKQVLDLIFPSDNLLTDWLAKAANAQQTSSENQWMRVANKLPGEKDRRVFDIAASYHKGSEAETILTLIDRTDVYMPEEDNLDFISFAAHELRGPITVIRGYLDVLQDELQPVLKPDQVQLMGRLVVASNRLTSYVNNILNAASYDRRHLKLRLSEEKLITIYESIADDMQQRASAQNRLLVADIPADLPTIAADVNAASEVLGNLIDNAIKYSNEGGLVHVVAAPIQGFIEVSIIDHGIGMPANVLPNLFHKFYRSHRSRETVAGTGIGLYICKAIVSSHGGSITARSVEGEGSTFTFTLPIYDTVAEKLRAGNNSNVSLIDHGGGWIKNHTLYKG